MVVRDGMLAGIIGVAAMTQLRTCVIEKKHSREVTQCCKSDLSYHKELLLRGRIRSLFPLREVPILKRDAIEENRWLIQ